MSNKILPRCKAEDSRNSPNCIRRIPQSKPAELDVLHPPKYCRCGRLLVNPWFRSQCLPKLRLLIVLASESAVYYPFQSGLIQAWGQPFARNGLLLGYQRTARAKQKSPRQSSIRLREHKEFGWFRRSHPRSRWSYWLRSGGQIEASSGLSVIIKWIIASCFFQDFKNLPLNLLWNPS